MDYEVKLTKTYLNKAKFSGGLLISSAILTICIVVSLFYWNQQSVFIQELTAKPIQVFEEFKYWKLFTTIFIHADIEHLLSNSFMIFFLSYFVYSFYGLSTILSLSLIGGAVTNYIVLWQMPSQVSLVGISGVIYLLWGFWLVLYLFINKKVSFIKRLLNILAIFFILLIPTSYNPQTSYMAHYVGLVIGSTIGLTYYLIKKEYFRRYEEYEVRPVPDFEKEELLRNEL